MELIIGIAFWFLLLFILSQLVSISRSAKRTADAVEELAMRSRGTSPKPQAGEHQAEWEKALAKARG